MANPLDIAVLVFAAVAGHRTIELVIFRRTDAIAIDVSRDNAAINGVKLGHGAGELLLAVADGMDSPLLTARAPFDLIIANILAGPLIELAPAFVKALAPGGTLILAGLLETQAEAASHDEHNHAAARSEAQPAFGADANVLEEFGHTHDHAEAATLLDPETRATLKKALDDRQH